MGELGGWVGCRGKAVGATAVQDAGARRGSRGQREAFLECSSPLELWAAGSAQWRAPWCGKDGFGQKPARFGFVGLKCHLKALVRVVKKTFSVDEKVLSHDKIFLSYVEKVLSVVKNLLTYVEEVLSYVENLLSCVEMFLSIVKMFLSYVKNLLSYVEMFLSYVKKFLTIVENSLTMQK